MFVCVSVCLSWCPCVCLSVCVHDNSKNNGSIDLKLKHIVVYENCSDEFDIGHCPNQGQGHRVTLKCFSIYHNTNCQGIYLSFGTC